MSRFHVDFETAITQITLQDIFPVTRKARIDVDRDELIMHRGPLTQLVKHMHQCVGILATGNGYSDSVPIFNQIEITDCPTGQLTQLAEMCVLNQQNLTQLEIEPALNAIFR